VTVKENPLERWLPLLQRYEITSLPWDLLLRGTLRPGLDGASPVVRSALEETGLAGHFQQRDGATEVVLVVPRAEDRPRLWIHALLFLATLLTTLAAGALLAGADPFGTELVRVGRVALPYPTGLHLPTLTLGAPFALPFLGVLLGHEMGHWTAARRHRIRASLPYFIPFPPYFSAIGTLGAFIRLKGATIRRSQLFDVGASGPFVSFVLSLPLFVGGLLLSEAVPGRTTLASPFVVEFAGQPVWLGNGPALHLLTLLAGPVAPGTDPILLHPFAFAGWLGLFVTALNLLPMGQLDGGHVLYALFGAGQGRAARLFFLALLPMGFLWWGWWAWAALVFILHRGRMEHPRVVQPEVRLGRGRTLLGWAVLAIFFLTIVPVPIQL
jgi:hypothetical protein